MTEVPQEALDAGRGYERLFVPALFASWTQHLITGADVASGQRVLDIACGSGVLARHALAVVGDTGTVTGVDPAPGMIAAAREVEPGIEWVLGAAEELDFADDAFDRVISQFGIMFFQDRLGALREMHRVLVPGGRLAIAVWNGLDHNPAYADIIAVMDEQVGTAAGDALRLPYCMGDARALADLLDQAGFAEIRVDTKSEQAHFPSPRTMVEAELRGWLPLFDIHLDEEKIASVLASSDRKLSKYASSSGEAVFPTSAHIVTAAKP